MLGIKKVMDSEFDLIPKSELQRLIDSEYFNQPMVTTRPNDGEYCEVEVLDCENEGWWYKDLIGYKFFCQIIYGDYGYGRFIKEFKGVKLSNGKMVVFKSFSPKDVSVV